MAWPTLVGGHHVGCQLLHDAEAQVVLPCMHSDARCSKVHTGTRLASDHHLSSTVSSKQRIGDLQG